MIIYSDIGDYINNVSFLAITPLYTEPVPKAIEDGLLEPFFIPEKNAMGRSRITIAQMIDMYNKNIPFTVLHNEELLVIKAALDEYSSKLKEFADQGNKSAITIYSSVSNFKKKIDNAVEIYFNSHPVDRKNFNKNDFTSLLKNYSQEQ